MDPRTYRRVLGHYPSGVVAVTSTDSTGKPVGLIASSFTSVSLDPPLIAFFPAKTSTTWPSIRDRGAFRVTVLSAAQEDVCRRLAVRGGDKFDGLEWTADERGLPVLPGAVAWIDCDIESVTDAGDHHIVVGRVRNLQADASTPPLLFFQGGYGQFSSASVMAISEADTIEHLQLVDSLRPALLDASRALGVEIFVTAASGHELVILSTSGHPDRARSSTGVGLRMPFTPPLGATVAAFGDWDAWLGRTRSDTTTEDHYRAVLQRISERGWSATVTTSSSDELERAMLLTRGDTWPTDEQTETLRQVVDKLGTDHELPELVVGECYRVRSVTVPVKERDGRARLALTAYGFPPESTYDSISHHVDVLHAVAARVHPPRTVLGR